MAFHPFGRRERGRVDFAARSRRFLRRRSTVLPLRMLLSRHAGAGGLAVTLHQCGAGAKGQGGNTPQ
jgi:hypothetical protein